MTVGTTVRYRIHDIDLALPLPSIVLGKDEAGIALLVRRHRVPIGFVLEDLAPRTVLEPTDVTRLLARTDPRWLLSTPRPPARTPTRPLSLTIVVCTHDRTDRLARCLRSLRRLRTSRLAEAVDLEMLVVDDAPSSDATHALVAPLPDVRYVREPHLGLDFARNRALREARGAFVAYVDDDVVVDTGWLDGFVEACTEHPDAVAVTGPVVAYELETAAQVLFERFAGFGPRFAKRRFGATHAGDPTYPCAPGMLGTGCNMTVRRDVARALGGFDEALDTGRPLPGGGDLDMLYRLARAGGPIVVEPRCLVMHEHRRKLVDFRHQMWTWGLGTMAFLAKAHRTDRAARPRIRRRVAQWFGFRLKSFAAACVGRDTLPIGTILAMTAGGVVGLCGAYGRSGRRVARIRREVAATARVVAEPVVRAG